LFRLEGTQRATSVTTDSKGGYEIDLKPGTYATSFQIPPSAPVSPPARPCPCPALRVAGPATVAILAGQTVVADFSETIQLL
jgi:hypothetical protein